MAETANDVITDAMQEIVLQASEAQIEAGEAQAGIRYLNRMMAKFDVEGIDLGYTAVSSLADIITIPDGAIDGLIANLAIALSPQYDVQPTPELRERAREGKEAMRLITFTIGPSSYWSTLPIGSGNEGDFNQSISHFYPDNQEDILAETTGAIGLESDTVEEQP